MREGQAKPFGIDMAIRGARGVGPSSEGKKTLEWHGINWRPHTPRLPEAISGLW